MKLALAALILLLTSSCNKFNPKIHIAEPGEGSVYFQNEEVHINAFLDGKGIQEYQIKIIDDVTDENLVTYEGKVSRLPFEIHEHYKNKLKHNANIRLILRVSGNSTDQSVFEETTFTTDSTTLDSQLKPSHSHHNHSH